MLRRYYAAPSDEAARRIADDLVALVVRPAAERVVRRRFGARTGESDVEDAVGDAILGVLGKLEKGRRGEERVDNLAAYANRTAGHACDELYRKRYPLRYNAMKRVQTQLRENEAFYAWHAQGALRAWPPPPPLPRPERLETLNREPAVAVERILHAFPPPKGPNPPKTAHCVWAALHWCEGALPVDALVLVVQTARGEFDPIFVEPVEGLGVEGPEPTDGAGAYLAAIWAEIRALPLNSRSVLLLNLRIDEAFGPEVFLDLGVASLTEIADALEMDREDFEKRVLPTLPWTDRRIAELLDCTESQVSGLRSSARRRLRRRLDERRGAR